MLQDLRNSILQGHVVPFAEIQPKVTRHGWRMLQVLALTLLWLGLYRPVFSSLISTWWAHDEFSYGFLVLPISLFVVWTKRQQLAQLPVKPARALGSLIMGIAAALLILSE